MRVMIALENRFYAGPSGAIYSNNVFDYRVWQRYLQVFDEVVVFARVGRVEQEPDKARSDGAGVQFYRLPMYIGPRQFLWHYRRLAALARHAPQAADAFILRVPGTMSRLLWGILRRRHIPFGVEVVGDAAESMNNCGAHALVKPVLKSLFSGMQRRQCQEAAAAAYVTQSYLQAKYPPGGWSTYYSSIELRDEDILTEAELAEKIRRLREAFEGKRRFVLCHAGTMAARYKGQELLIEAAAVCLKRGLDLEVVLMGDGKFRRLYEQRAATLGIADRVRFLGNVSGGKAVRDEYDKADVLVFPSLTEGLPRTIIEAMARGLICIGSRVGGIPELLGDEFLFEAGDVKGLVAKIIQLNKMKADFDLIPKRNIEQAKEFRYEILNERQIQFYMQLLNMAKAI